MRFEVVRCEEAGPFDFRWWEPGAGLEHFDRSWTCEAVQEGRIRHLRHGIGRRFAYGRERVHSVTWLDGQPVVEGVEADDYPSSRALLSAIKLPDRKLARRREDLPPAYERFPIVDHRAEIDAPYSRRALAVKIREDDLASWVALALLRARILGGPVPKKAPRTEAPARLAPPPAPTAPTREPARQQAAVAAALLAYAASYSERDPGSRAELAPEREADDLVHDDPFAFLLGVIFDQGIPYQRAWQAPLELRRRLGHLDPTRLATDPEAVRRAVQVPTPLHRYVETVPRWVAAAAHKVATEFGGDAGRIWSDRPTARQLIDRLLTFDGIGLKKAAMAVEMLERDLGVPVREMGGSDIAYDVHVRRVFLRTGLAERDDEQHMIEVARALHPERPGALDDPVWRVGKLWCHASEPDCPDCPITEACPKLIDRARDVRGG